MGNLVLCHDFAALVFEDRVSPSFGSALKPHAIRLCTHIVEVEAPFVAPQLSIPWADLRVSSVRLTRPVKTAHKG